MPIELRWAVSLYTTTEKPVLQWREIGIPGSHVIHKWMDVPVVVVDPIPTPPTPDSERER